MSYQIELNDQRFKPRQTTSLHLITGFALLGIGAFTFLLGNTNWVQTVFHAPLIPASLLGAISLSYGIFLLCCIFFKNKWLQATQTNKAFRVINTLVAAVLAIVFVCSQWWLAAGIAGIGAAANLFAYFYEQKMVQPLFVCFEEGQIVLPATARRKSLLWTEVDRVLLRHGTVTVDCVNNFLYQWTVKYNDIDAAALEAFCSRQIELNREKRGSEDW